MLHYTLCYQYDFEGCDYAFKAILIFFLHLISYSVRNKCICIHKPYDISITIELHLANNFIPNKNKEKKDEVKKIPPPLKTRLKKNHTHKKTPKYQTLHFCNSDAWKLDL